MTLLLGCIADDFTGATDLANNLMRVGMRVGMRVAHVDDARTDAQIEQILDRNRAADFIAVRERIAPAFNPGPG